MFADYFQFYLQDDGENVGSLAEAWTDDARQRLRIAVAPGVVGVATARNDTVKVDVELSRSEPPIDPEPWRHVIEADLLCATGRIVIAGCTDYLPDARRLEGNPGRYRVRVHYGVGVKSDDGIGDVMPYLIHIWRAAAAQPVSVLKQGPVPWAG